MKHCTTSSILAVIIFSSHSAEFFKLDYSNKHLNLWHLHDSQLFFNFATIHLFQYDGEVNHKIPAKVKIAWNRDT